MITCCILVLIMAKKEEEKVFWPLRSRPLSERDFSFFCIIRIMLPVRRNNAKS